MLKRITLFICFFTYIIKGHSQTGIGTSSPSSDLQVAGATALAVRTVTTNSTLGFTDQVLIFTGSSASTITLPSAINCIGRVYWIKNASTLLPPPVLTVLTVSSQTIDLQSSWILDEPNEVVRITSDGSNWQVFSQNTAVRKTTTVGSAWLQGGNKLKSIKSFGTIENVGFSLLSNNTVDMHLSNNGYWGLGTNAPQGRIHSVTESDEAANDYYFSDHSTSITQGFFVRKARGSVTLPSDLQNGDLIGQMRFAARYNGGLVRNAGAGFDTYYTGNGTSSSTDFRIFTSDLERLRVNSLGYVGIGTSSFDATYPERLLVDAGNASSYNVISGKGETDNYLQLNIKNGNGGNTASSDIVATADNGNETVNYIDMGINSSGFSNTALPILDGANTAYLFGLGNDMKIGPVTAYNLSFFTNGFALSNERMRITASGDVAIGAVAPSDKLSVGGIFTPATDNSFTIGKSGARWSEVYATNGTIQTSDIRLKKNIAPLHYGINTLVQIEPVSYKWKSSNDSTNHIGVIAQQIEKLIPEVVENKDSNDMLGVNYAEMVPVLILALQEQQKKLRQLQSKLKKLSH